MRKGGRVTEIGLTPNFNQEAQSSGVSRSSSVSRSSGVPRSRGTDACPVPENSIMTKYLRRAIESHDHMPQTGH